VSQSRLILRAFQLLLKGISTAVPQGLSQSRLILRAFQHL